MNKHVKVTQSPNDLSKQLHFDDNEDTGRLVLVKRSEQKKKAKQKMDDAKELLKEHGWQVSRADHCIRPLTA